MQIKPYYTVKEVSEMLNVSERTVYRRIKDGSIQCVKFGREFRILKEDFNKYLKKIYS